MAKKKQDHQQRAIAAMTRELDTINAQMKEAYAQFNNTCEEELIDACIDLSVLGQQLMDQLGEEGSKVLFVKTAPGDYPGYPEGHDDNTHFCQDGALIIASLVAKEMKKAFPGKF